MKRDVFLILKRAFFLLCLLQAPWIVVLLLYSDEVVLSPSIFIHDYFRFEGSLIAAFVSFALIYLLWHRQGNRSRKRRVFCSLKAVQGRLHSLLIYLEHYLLDPAISDSLIVRRKVRVDELVNEMKQLSQRATTLALELEGIDEDEGSTALGEEWLLRHEPRLMHLLMLDHCFGNTSDEYREMLTIVKTSLGISLKEA